MGSYATTTTISQRLPGLMVGDTTTSDSTLTTVFSSFIDKAETYFNAVAAKSYTVPFTVIPPLAREMSFDMAAYWTILAFSTRDWPNRNEMLEDYKQVFDMLKMLESGDLKLTLTDGSIISQATTALISSNRSGQGAIFDVDEPTDWKVDENRLSDLEGSRD
jgi:phage gp36-like protein